MTKRGLR